jgi:hypothetical protein
VKNNVAIIGDLESQGQLDSNYDVAPDGQFIMLKSVEESPPTQLNIIFNWVEELKRRVPTN